MTILECQSKCKRNGESIKFLQFDKIQLKSENIELKVKNIKIKKR